MANIVGGSDRTPEKHLLSDAEQPDAKRARSTPKQVSREAIPPAASSDTLDTIGTLLFKIKANRPNSREEKTKNMLAIADSLERLAHLATTPGLDKEEYSELFREFEKLIRINQAEPNDVTSRIQAASKVIQKALNLPTDDLEEMQVSPTKKKKLRVSFSPLPDVSRAAIQPQGSFEAVSKLLLERSAKRGPLYQALDLLVGLNTYLTGKELTASDRQEIKEFVASIPSMFQKPINWPPAEHSDKGAPSLLTKLCQQYKLLQEKLR